jgi:hypothetical protein
MDLTASYKSGEEEIPQVRPFSERPQTEMTFGDLTCSETTFYGTNSIINSKDLNNVATLS